MNVVVVKEQFFRHMRSVGYSQATIDSYEAGLNDFLKFLNSKGIDDIRQVTRQTVDDYQRRVMSRHLAPETKAIRLRPVKRLFEHLEKSNRILISPTQGLVEISRRHRKIGPVLTIGQINRLMKVPDLKTPVGLRNRTIMEVLYSTGIRAGELVGLQVADIDFDDETLFVRRGKGNQQRLVPLGERAAFYLSSYLENSRPQLQTGSTTALFLLKGGRALTKGALSMFLKKYRVQAGLDVPVSPHVFRRSCATHLLSQGAGIRYVQQLLGHSDLSVTQYYTKVLPVELKRTHEKTHPGLDHATD